MQKSNRKSVIPPIRLSKRTLVIEVSLCAILPLVMFATLITGNNYAREQEIGKNQRYSSIYEKPIEHAILIGFLVFFFACGLVASFLLVLNLLMLLSFIEMRKNTAEK